MSRDAAHVLRLAMIYVLADRTGVVSAGHIRAALAIVAPSRRAAASIFGSATGHADADGILGAWREAPRGLTLSETRQHVLGESSGAGRRRAALGFLVHHGLVREIAEPGRGRPATRDLLIATPAEKGEKGEVAVHGRSRWGR